MKALYIFVTTLILLTCHLGSGAGADAGWNNTKLYCDKKDFRCRDNYCIEVKRVCDGEEDCRDGSDEEDCFEPKVSKMCGEVIENAQDPRQLAPWVVGIFKRTPNQQWDYICGGTITSSGTVITAAHCAKDHEIRIQYSHLSYRDLRIVAALKSSNYNDRDEHTQEREVAQVREHQVQSIRVDLLGTANLAGIRLKTKFNFNSSYVRPVCIIATANTIEEIVATRPGDSIRLAGFDMANPMVNQNLSSLNKNLNKNKKPASKLEIHNLTLIEPTECARLYKNVFNLNVYCGKNFNDTTPVPCSMEGHGMIGQTDGNFSGIGKYYLMGVYTSNSARSSREFKIYSVLTTSDQPCEVDKDVVFFTKLGEHSGWAKSQQKCPVGLFQCQSDDACRSPQGMCDGIADCNDETDESEVVCSNFQPNSCLPHEFRCNYGACIPNTKLCDGHVDCVDASDENDDDCLSADVEARVTCPPLRIKTGVQVKCYLPTSKGGSEVNCKSRFKVGTQVVAHCIRYFTPEDSDSSITPSDPLTATCRRNGNWSDEISFRCKPDCGISEVGKRSFISGGQNVSYRAEFPWHAAIFRRNSKNRFLLVCGGSLISPNVILTAAHCLTPEHESNALRERDHKVVLGSLTSSFYTADEFTQTFAIRKFVIETSYGPISKDSDIALIILDKPIKITQYVRPVCVPRPADAELSKQQLENANPITGHIFGTAVGYGLDENQQLSVTLKKLNMPVIPPNICSASLRSVLHEHIRYTWICAGYTNGSAVCPGDSGGGLVFPHETTNGRKYYVQGIVSHGPQPLNSQSHPCSANTYKIFTNVYLFSQWIYDKVREFKPTQSY